MKRLAISLDQGNRAMTHDSMEMQANTSIVGNFNVHVNGSLCQIANLEVYRGQTQTTEINHAGFILSNEGTFEVNNLISKICVLAFINIMVYITIFFR